MARQQFTNPQDTPLRFHYYFHYVILPMGTLANVFLLFAIVSLFPDGEDYTWLAIIFSVVQIALAAIAFTGLFKWKRSGYYSLVSYLVLSPLFAMVMMILLSVSGSESTQAAVSQFGSNIAYSIVAGAYYYRRRALFLGAAGDEEGVEDVDPYAESTVDEAYSDLSRLFGGYGDRETREDEDGVPPSGNDEEPSQPGDPAAANEPAEGSPSVCVRCGSRLRPGGQFCGQCGEKAE